MLACFHQIHEQVVEVERMLGERLVQRGTPFDIARIDPAARAALTLLADARGRHALPAQFCAQSLLIGREALALDARAALVLALPGEGSVAFDRPECAACCRSHRFLPSCVTRR